LVWDMLGAGVIQDGYWQPTLTGVPQGAVVTLPTKLRKAC
jgi:hypothetical protein